MIVAIRGWLRNRRWLDSKADQYPHFCHTKKNSPRPEDVSRRIPQLVFIRSPLVDYAEWRFETEDDMKLFKQVYVTLDNKE